LSSIKLDKTDFEDSHDAKPTLSAYMSQKNYQDNTIISPVFLPRKSRVCAPILMHQDDIKQENPRIESYNDHSRDPQ
jgi:hypothetical protein